jgi:hypothetical protein
LKSAAAAAAGRKFGLTVGSAFTVLALIGRWRGHHTSFAVLGTLGVLLLVAALVVPTALGPVERVWMAAAHAISRVTTPIFMGVVYFIILTPVGFIRRAVGGNALAHRSGKDGFWSDRSRQPRSSLDRQF